MKNLNKVKGNASKMEALMKKAEFQPNLKHRKLSREHKHCFDGVPAAVPGGHDDEAEDVVEDRDCNCCDEDPYEEEVEGEEEEMFVPTIQDFVTEIKNSRVLDDGDKSRQLYLLIQLFLKVKDLSHDKDKTTLKLPSIKS